MFKTKRIKVIVLIIRIFFSIRNLRYISRNLLKNFKTSLMSLHKGSTHLSWKRINFANKGSQIRLGIIGGGKFANNHLRVLYDMEDVDICSMLSRGSNASKALAEKYEINNFTTDINDFIKQNLDAVIVVSSIPQLYKLSECIIQAGIPALIEKPVTFNTHELNYLIKISEENSTFVQVGYNRRFYSIVEHGLSFLANHGPIRGGVLEVPESILENKNLNTKDKVVVDNWIAAQSSHAIDLFNYILGGWEVVKHLSNWKIDSRNVGASYVAAVSFPNNVYGSIIGLWDTPHQWRLRIIAETGSLEFSPLECGWALDSNGTRSEISEDHVDLKYKRGIYAQDRYFIECIQNNFNFLPPPGCSLHDALRTLELIEELKI